MTRPLRAVLWDADGVLQRHGDGWRAEYAAFGGVPDGFIEDVWAAEVPLLSGGDFPAAVAAVAERYDVRAPLDALLSRWRGSALVEDTLGVVADLRAAGVGCYLATNQNAYRCGWMREHLGLEELLDGSFYSCELGAAKPGADFFGAILAELRLDADEVGFVDDSAANVEAATRAGLRAHAWHHDDGTTRLVRIIDRLTG